MHLLHAAEKERGRKERTQTLQVLFLVLVSRRSQWDRCGQCLCISTHNQDREKNLPGLCGVEGRGTPRCHVTRARASGQPCPGARPGRIQGCCPHRPAAGAPGQTAPPRLTPETPGHRCGLDIADALAETGAEQPGSPGGSGPGLCSQV